MVNFYVRRIKAGKMTLEEVPARWYDAVKKALEEEEINQSENLTISQISTII